MTLRDFSAFRIPAAPLVFDAAAIAARLRTTLFAADPAAASLRAVPTYLRLKPGTMLLATWRVELNDEGATGAKATRVEHVHGVMGPGTLTARERQKWKQLHPSLAPRSDFLDLDGGDDLVLARFPFDAALKRLPSIARPDRIKRYCAELPDAFGDGVPVAVRETGTSVALRSWRPRRRAVVEWNLRARGPDGFVRRPAFARLLAEAARAGLAWRRDELPAFLPRVLSATVDEKLVLEQRIDGEEFCGDGLPARGRLAALGDLVGRFHAFSRTRVERVKTAPLRWSQLVRRAGDSLRDATALVPALATAARAAFAALDGLPRPDGFDDLVIAHGDLHLGQVLATATNELALCDFDRAELAPRELDLGRLVGDLIARGMTFDEALAALRESYAAASRAPFDGRRLKPFTAAALLIAAGEPLRRFAANAESAARQRIEQAHRLLQQQSALSVGAAQ